MNSDTPLDCAVFELSPRRSRCELFVSGNGRTEKIASGFLKPFLTHLKVVEEQAACSDKSIKLELEGSTVGNRWFNKGTLERFVRFVSTPEVLESVNTCDAEMSQLEGASRIYSQGAGKLSGRAGEDDTSSVAAADVTKNELLRAIDLRLVTLKQDLATACARACSAGFSIDNASELLLFAEYFGAIRLIEACNKFILICQKHPDLTAHQSQSLHHHLKSFAEQNLRSSSSSDMSIDELELQLSAGNPPDDGDPQHYNANRQTSRTESTVTSGTSQQAMSILQQKAASEEPIASASSANEPAQQDRGGSRRLSVQDRINLFESKQKEQSANSGNATSAGVNRVISGKGHRRLSSDVSEKSVLRRWSGASDMSIDLTSSTSNSINDIKGSGSTIETPTSTNLQLPLRVKTETKASGSRDPVTSQGFVDQRSTDISSSLHYQNKGFYGDGDGNKDEGVGSSLTKVKPDVEKGKHCVNASTGWDKQTRIHDENNNSIYQKTFPDNRNNTDSGDLAISTLQSKEGCQFQMKDQTALFEIGQAQSAIAEHVNRKDQEIVHPRTRETLGRDGAGTKYQGNLVNQSWTFGRRTGAEVKEVKAKGPFGSQVQMKVLSGSHSESDLQASQSQGKILPVKVEEAGARNAPAFHVPSGNSQVKTKEDTYNMEKRIQQKLSVCETTIDELKDNKTNSTPALPSRMSKKALDVIEPPSAHGMEQLQVTKQSKGNQDLNDELRIKANELEKLFAAHKLRTPSDQTDNNWRSMPVGLEDQAPVAMDKRHAMIPTDILLKKSLRETCEKEMEIDSAFMKPMAGKKEYGSVDEKLDNFSSSDDSRGKLYYAYMQKRDAKLVVEWQTERAQKEAKMKAMRESLEHSLAEMDSRYSGSVVRQVSNKTYLREEKVRSFGKRRNEAVESVAEGEEDLDKLYEQVDHGQQTSYNMFANNIKSLKLLPNKALSSSTPRTPVSSNPKPSVKSTKLVSTKSRSPTENPHAGSLPSFTDFRKENKKPSAATNRVSTRERTKILSRSKSIVEETNHVMEDKSRRSQSMRKSAAMPGELDLSSLNSDIPDTSLPGFDRPHADTVCTNKAQKSKEPKSFARKGKVASPCSGISISKPKASAVSGMNKDGEYYESIIQQGNLPDLNKDLHERSSAQGDTEIADYPLDTDSEKLRQSQEYENSDDCGSEDGDLQSLSQVDYGTAPVSPKFKHPAGNVEVSPGESPRSWNSNVHPDTSDIDVCAESPIGSPASWSLNPLNQMEADASRIRKKWGSAQMPVIAANVSQPSRRDVTKGFKRLLKFGRKSRGGVESLVSDWVSASTASEGDDDTEDDHDVVNRPTEDLRKSRMGYSLAHGRFNEGEMFSERAESLRSSIPNPPANFKLREDHLTGSSLKAPRSFFSLSSFRSKETKLR